MTRSSREDVLEDEEIEALITAAQGHDRDIITIMIFSGLRAGEIEHMDKSWIKWQHEKIQVPKEFNGWSPKTKNSPRNIPIIDKRLKEALRAFFYHFEKVPYQRTTIWRKVKKAAIKAKIQHKVYPHALRATFATKLAYLGISASSMQHILGWANLSTSERYIKSTGSRAIEEVKQKWKS